MPELKEELQNYEVLQSEVQVDPELVIDLEDVLEEPDIAKVYEELIDTQVLSHEEPQPEPVLKQHENYSYAADLKFGSSLSTQQSMGRFNIEFEGDLIDLKALLIFSKGICKGKEKDYRIILEELISEESEIIESIQSIGEIQLGKFQVIINGETCFVGPIAIEGTPWECRNTLAFLALKEILPRLNAKRES